MKILVIDDSKVHLAAAKQTLAEHDVTVCNDHDAAIDLLRPQYDAAEKSRLLDLYKEQGIEWNERYERAERETRKPYWDVVLTDLLMPAGRNAQGNAGFKYVGQEMPVGWSLALQAAKNDALYVAVVTDMNHHHHPASAMLDALNGHLFTIDVSKVLFTNRVERVGIVGTECTCEECGGTGQKKRDDGSQYGCYHCDQTGRSFAEFGKDWGKIFAKLVGTAPIDE